MQDMVKVRLQLGAQGGPVCGPSYVHPELFQFITGSRCICELRLCCKGACSCPGRHREEVLLFGSTKCVAGLS